MTRKSLDEKALQEKLSERKMPPSWWYQWFTSPKWTWMVQIRAITWPRNHELSNELWIDSFDHRRFVKCFFSCRSDCWREFTSPAVHVTFSLELPKFEISALSDPLCCCVARHQQQLAHSVHYNESSATRYLLRSSAIVLRIIIKERDSRSQYWRRRAKFSNRRKTAE